VTQPNRLVTPPSELARSLQSHSPADAEEAADLAQILAFVYRHENPFDRRIPSGHLTGSALILSSDGRQVLLLHHLKLVRWLQPGGHAESGEGSGEVVALREAREETGLPDLALHPEAPRPLDVDIHDIPARPGEPAHEHLDLRYLVIAPRAASLAPGDGESARIRWFDWDELPSLGLDPGLVRALAKARAFAKA
jgi:8-oxo-dGTP pyrophosphatase MutT (NUDIX family)